MQILWGAEARPDEAKPTVVTVGMFDGVHRGHALLFSRVLDEARKLDARPAIVTFEPHPLEVLAPDRAPCVLTTIDQRLALFESHGMEIVLVLAFDSELAALDPEDFVRVMLVEDLHVRKVMVGEDFRFGHNRAGDVTTLAELGTGFEFEAEAIGLLGEGSQKIGSSDIRRLIGEGNVSDAAELLGRNYRLAGTVVEGDKRGRKLGFPTANLGPHVRACLPGNGVYAGWWVSDERSSSEARGVRGAQRPRSGDRRQPGVINVGVRPTFETSDPPLCEIHIFDLDEDLYGRQGEVEFEAFLRPEQRFDGVDALVAQITADADRAKAMLSGE